MENEKRQIYQELLTRYCDSCYGKEHDREQFAREFEEFLHDPEFLNMFLENEECRKARAYATRPTVDGVFVKPFVDKLRAFGQGTPVEFSDVDLQVLADLYQEIPEFQELCAKDPVLSQAISYWLDELERRASHDERFAMRDLLAKLQRFHADPSIEFSDSDLDLLDYFYRHNAEFHHTCDQDIVVRKSLAYWLEERQRRSSKSKDATHED